MTGNRRDKKPRMLPRQPHKPALVPVCITSADPSQDRIISRQEAMNRYRAGQLSWIGGTYCLRLEDYNPARDSAPRIPEFLLNAPRREEYGS